MTGKVKSLDTQWTRDQFGDAVATVIAKGHHGEVLVIDSEVIEPGAEFFGPGLDEAFAVLKVALLRRRVFQSAGGELR